MRDPKCPPVGGVEQEADIFLYILDWGRVVAFLVVIKTSHSQRISVREGLDLLAITSSWLQNVVKFLYTPELVCTNKFDPGLVIEFKG